MRVSCQAEDCSVFDVSPSELYSITIEQPVRYHDREDITPEFTLLLCEEHVHDVLDMGPVRHKTNERDEGYAATTRTGPGADDVAGGNRQ